MAAERHYKIILLSETNNGKSKKKALKSVAPNPA